MSLIGMFRKPYIIKRFGEQEIINGLAFPSLTYFTASLNVQSPTPSELFTLPEGQRTLDRVKAFGDAPMQTADEDSDTQSDLLWYHGKWYECKGSAQWDHTILAHWVSEWVMVEKQPDPPPDPLPDTEVTADDT